MYVEFVCKYQILCVYGTYSIFVVRSRYYYMMHSEQTDERWVIGGTGYADFIVRSRNLSAWEESLCSDGQGGCPWLHYAQPGDKEPQNRFMPRWQQERLATSRNRCNSDIDLVT